MKKEKMQEYIMHNYEKNIHIEDVDKCCEIGEYKRHMYA